MGKMVTFSVKPAVVVRTDAGDEFHLWADPASGVGRALMRAGGVENEGTSSQTMWGRRFVTAVPDGRVRLDFDNGEYFFLTKPVACELGLMIMRATVTGNPTPAPAPGSRVGTVDVSNGKGGNMTFQAVDVPTAPEAREPLD